MSATMRLTDTDWLRAPALARALSILNSGGGVLKQFFTARYPDGLAFGDGPYANSIYANNNDGSFTITGTHLTGVSEGATYGDEAEMSSNYPIVKLTDSNGNVIYARPPRKRSIIVNASSDEMKKYIHFNRLYCYVRSCLLRHHVACAITAQRADPLKQHKRPT